MYAADITRLKDAELHAVRGQAFNLKSGTRARSFWHLLWADCCREVRLRRETREALSIASGLPEDCEPLRSEVERIRMERSS